MVSELVHDWCFITTVFLHYFYRTDLTTSTVSAAHFYSDDVQPSPVTAAHELVTLVAGHSATEPRLR